MQLYYGIIIKPSHSLKNIGLTDISDIVYYSFVCMTTIGFGEIIPQSQIAKSLSIFSGIVGQFYLTIIMALIIGKLLNSMLKN
ncbi:ion channel [Ancylomarina euxina]|nr:potassium channel family protein [Ancylomarina euxinus]